MIWRLALISPCGLIAQYAAHDDDGQLKKFSKYYVNGWKCYSHGWGLPRYACLIFNAMGSYEQLPIDSVVVDRISISVVSWPSSDQT